MVAFSVCNSAPTVAFTSTMVDVAPNSRVTFRVSDTPTSTF